MKGFSSDLTDNIRVQLEEEKKTVLDRVAALSDQDPFSDPDRSNDNAATDKEATEESSHDRVASQIATLKAQVGDIDAALARIGAGSYGFCSHCHKMIDTDRLAILPTATLCLSCESKKKGS